MNNNLKIEVTHGELVEVYSFEEFNEVFQDGFDNEGMQEILNNESIYYEVRFIIE